MAEVKKEMGMFSRLLASFTVIFLVCVAILAYIVLKMPWMEWDNTEEDRTASIPGDNLVKAPVWQYTHAIDINAPAEKIWPWVNQIGQDRGGFYSYAMLENAVGCKLKNADKINPLWQYKGDGREKMILHPQMPGLKVEKVIPNIALIVHGGNFVKGDKPVLETSKDYVNMSWIFYLKKVDWNKTRLMVRWRAGYYPSKENEMWYGPRLTGFMNFFMGDRMIRGIKERSERMARQETGDKSKP